jgi:chloramphenicol-sensitive protein RarD
MTEQRKGLLAAVCAYTMWGLFPLYWPLLRPAGPYEMVAHRIVWTALLMVVLVVLWQRLDRITLVWRDQHQRRWLLAAATLISFNWTTYVWALENNRIVETALGYFINPIVTICFGVVLFREKLRPLQWLALGLGSLAVLVMTVGYGEFPIVAMILAFSFGTYGLCKKKANAAAVESLTLESLAVAPLALLFIAWLTSRGESHFTTEGVSHVVLFISTGVVTAVPLLFFSAAATRVPMVTLGLIQYFAPLMQFVLGVYYFGEPMPAERWAGFILVWLAIVLITVESIVHHRRSNSVVTVEEPAL